LITNKGNNMKLLLIGIVAISIIYFFTSQSSQGTPSISSASAQSLLDDEDYIFLDVRTLAEHENLSIPNTSVIPIEELANRVDELEKYKDKKIILYCRSGNRSGTGTTMLRELGYDAINLTGGMNQWSGITE